MKNFYPNFMRAILLLILAGCFLTEVQGQTLGEVLRATQRRAQLLAESNYVQAQLFLNSTEGKSGTYTGNDSYSYLVDRYKAIAQNPITSTTQCIAWNGLSDAMPSDATVNALPIESQLVLLGQANQQIQQMLNQYIDPRKMTGGIGRVMPLYFLPLDRLNLSNFHQSLKILENELLQMNTVLWPVDYEFTGLINETSSPTQLTPPTDKPHPWNSYYFPLGEIPGSYVNTTFGFCDAIYDLYDGTAKNIGSYNVHFYKDVNPTVNLSQLFAGNLEYVSCFGYGVNALNSLTGSPHDSDGDSYYNPDNQVSTFSQLSAQATLSINHTTYQSDASTSYALPVYKNSSVPIVADLGPACINLYHVWNTTFGSDGNPIDKTTCPSLYPFYCPTEGDPELIGFSNAPYYNVAHSIGLNTYFVADFGLEFQSLASNSYPTPPPEPAPALQVVPRLEKEELVVPLATAPENNCELVWNPNPQTQTYVSPLCIRNNLDVRGSGNWVAVYSGRPADREPEITTWPTCTTPYTDGGTGGLNRPGTSYLRWSDFNSYVSEWWHPVLTQLITATYALNITQQGEFQYQIDFYRKDQASSTKTSGRYTFTGNPVESFVVQNPTGDDNQIGSMKITGKSAVYNITRTASQNNYYNGNNYGYDYKWTFNVQSPGGTTLLNKAVTTTETGSHTVVDQTTIDGTTLPQVTTVYDFYTANPIDLYQVVEVDPIDGTRTTGYSYPTGSNGVYNLTQTGGVNPFTATYDPAGQLTDYVSGSNEVKLSYSDSTVNRTELFNGTTVRATTSTYSPDLSTITTTTSGAPDAMAEVTQYYPGTDPINPWALQMIGRSDGTFSTFNYAWSGGNFVTTVESGGNSYGTFSTVEMGQRQITTVNPAGVVIKADTYDILSGVETDYADKTAYQAGTLFPSTINRPLGTTEQYSYDGEGRVLSHTDRQGVVETYTRDALDRVTVDTRNTLSSTIAYNQGSLGRTVTTVDTLSGTRTRTEQGSAFGATQTVTTTGPENVTVTRTETPTTITTTTNNSTTAQNVTETVQKASLATAVTGNATEPWNISYAFTGAGWNQTTTHGVSAAVSTTINYDPLGRVTQQTVPDPNGSGTQTTKYSYTSGFLNKATDPDGTTQYGFWFDGSLQTMSRGGRTLTWTPVSGVVGWQLSDGIETVWKKTWNPNSGILTTWPWGDQAQAITSTPTLSGTTFTQTVQGTDGSKLTNQWLDGVPSGGSVTEEGAHQSWSSTADGFGVLKSLSEQPGASGNLNYTFSTLGLPTSVSGLVSGTFSDSFDATTGHTHTTTINGNASTQIESPVGYSTSLQGYGAPNTTQTVPAFGSSSITSTLTTAAGSMPFTYSPAGTLLNRKFTDGSAESFAYTAGGALSSWTTPRNTFNLNPNVFGQPQGLMVGASSLASFGYDGAGRLNSVTDAAGSRILGYTKGLVTSEAWNAGPNAGQTVGYGYTAGLLTQVTLPNNIIKYGYNNVTISSVTTAGGTTVTLGANDPATGRPTTVTYSTGVTKSLTMDGLGRATNETTTAGGTSLSYGTTYDANNHASGQTNPYGSFTYGYDPAKGYLTSASYNVQNLVHTTLSYAVDDAGRSTTSGTLGSDYYPLQRTNPGSLNVMGWAVPGTTLSITNINLTNNQTTTLSPTSDGTTGQYVQLYSPPADSWQNFTVTGSLTTAGSAGIATASVRKGASLQKAASAPSTTARAQQTSKVFVYPTTETLTYDGEGNRTGDELWTYTWNALDQMTSAVQKVTPPGQAGPTELDFINDVQGRRVQKRVSVLTSQGLVLQSSTTTLYDGWRPVLDTDTDGTGRVTARRAYTWGPDMSGSLDGAAGVGGLLEIAETINGVTTLSAPVYDGNGNICGLVDEQTGAVVDRVLYGPYGEIIGQFGSRNCPLLFSTKRYDPETKLYCFGKRYYDPKTQSWLSRDPIREEGGINHYAYCQNNPVGQVDAIGLADVYLAFDKNGNPILNQSARIVKGVPQVHYYENTVASFLGLGSVHDWWETPSDSDLKRLFRKSDSGWLLAGQNAREDVYTQQFNQELPGAVDQAGQTINIISRSTAVASGPVGLTTLGTGLGGSLLAAHEFYSAGANGVSLATGENYFNTPEGQVLHDSGYGDELSMLADAASPVLVGYANVPNFGSIRGSVNLPYWLIRVRQGNAFNAARRAFYPYNEVYIGTFPYKKLDSYNPNLGEIVSRKDTQFSTITEQTGINYIKQLASDYPPGALIANVPSSGTLAGQKLLGDLILEVPPQIAPIPQSVINAAQRANVIIRDTNGTTY